MARNMIVAGLKSGKIRPGGTIVESSSGNTGIGLALASIEYGLRFIAVVDHHAAQDKIAIMRALGAKFATSPATTVKMKWRWWNVSAWRHSWHRKFPVRCL